MGFDPGLTDAVIVQEVAPRCMGRFFTPKTLALLFSTIRLSRKGARPGVAELGVAWLGYFRGCGNVPVATAWVPELFKVQLVRLIGTSPWPEIANSVPVGADEQLATANDVARTVSTHLVTAPTLSIATQYASVGLAA